jgi:hypothetical protein
MPAMVMLMTMTITFIEQGYVFSLLFVYLYCSIIFTPSNFIISVFLVVHQLRNGFLILIAASYEDEIEDKLI